MPDQDPKMRTGSQKQSVNSSQLLLKLEQIQQQIALQGLNEKSMREAGEMLEKLGPRKINAAVAGHPTVSLCMIAKNEEAHLARCLFSVCDIVDEIIVVDTGSTDQTREIAKIFRARVYPYEWTDDFSEARNVSLEKAEGDWIFVLDADEVIGKSDRVAFRKLLTQNESKPVAYQFDTRNYCNEINVVGWIPKDGRYPKEEAGNGWTSSRKARLFPNDCRIRFHYPVHEMIEPSLEGIEVKLEQCGIPIHHYGKLVQKTTEAKKDAYYQLGKKKLSSFSGNAWALREIAIQAGIVGDHREAAELWERYVSVCPKDCTGHVFLATSYGQLGQQEKAVDASKRALSLDPDNIEAHYNYGLSLFLLGEGAQAKEAFQEVLRLQPGYLPASFMLGAAYCSIGMPEKGKTELTALKASALAPELPSRCLELTKGLLTYQKLDAAIALLETAVACEIAPEGVQPFLSNLHQFKNSMNVNATSSDGAECSNPVDSSKSRQK